MKKKIFAGLLGVTFCVLYFAVAMLFMPLSYGWYTGGKTMFFNAAGSSVASYFESGKGTHEDPYIISNPKHMYNLAWLQYLGMFNETDSDGNLKEQYHFKLKNDIDMTVPVGGVVYQAIPPIGTMEYPFVGHFDGNGKTVSNVIVANSKKAGAIIQSPPAIESGVVRYAEIIGFFGVIGEYNGVGKVTDDQLKALVVENLNLDNITIATSTTSSLAGLFAGYVNGTAKNVNVLGGTIDTAENVLPYTETFNVTGKDAEGNSVIKEFILNAAGAISNYTLIGDYLTTLIKWEGGGIITGPTTDVGQGQGFGGSIDMLTLAKRLTYMYGAATVKTESSYKRPNETVMKNNHAYVSVMSKEFDYESTSDLALFFNENTYLPLNIDNVENLAQSQYTQNSAELASTENTGFIVGHQALDASAAKKPLSLKNRKIGQLCNSIQGGSSSTGAWKSLTYKESVNGQNLQILTIDVNGDYYVIGDNVNKLTAEDDPYDVYKNAQTSEGDKIKVKTYQNLNLTQYDGATANRVRTKLGEMLESNDNIFGLHFNTYSTPSTSNLLKLGEENKVSLGGKEVTSLVKGTIHFNVKDAGVITLVAATVSAKTAYIAGEHYSATASSYVLPMLYRVVRDEEGVIKDLIAITVICKNNSTGEITYNDTLVDGKTAPAGKTVLYNYNVMGRLTTSNSNATSRDMACMQSLFYFEIPVGAGEYVFGGNNMESPFLLYLDIGGNAGSSGGSGEGGSGGTEPPPKPTGEISGIAFAYQNGTTYTKITHDGTNVVTYKISGPKDSDGNPVKTHSGAAITFTPSNASNMEVAFSNSNTGQFAVSKNDPPNTGSG